LAKSRLLTPPVHLRYWKFLRLSILALADVVIFAACYWLSFVLRLDSLMFPEYAGLFLKTLPVMVTSHLLVYWAGGIYKQVWRFANINCAILIGKCGLVSLILFLGANFMMGSSHTLPRSIPIICFLLVFLAEVATKFSWRFWTSFQLSVASMGREPCFIYGAGRAGELLARHISASPQFPFSAVGFIDDDKNKAGKVLHGLKIIGTRDDLPRLAAKYQVSTVVLAMHAASGKVLREIVDTCTEAGIKPLIVPDISHALDSNVVRPRALDIKDLLRRSPKSIDTNAISNFFRGAVVMVTGAGGSIGSEICTQIAGFGPRKIVLFDSCEYNLYRIEKELSDARHWRGEIAPVLGSVVNERLVRETLRTHRPTIILHAAAYKHVYLVEENPLEGIINNVLGTKVLTKAAVQNGVESFLLISTDKAVRPTSIMGATKRCCELIVQAAHRRYGHSTKFCAVRFGNVLGSSGSVVPRFLEQIQHGGPVTVTHPEVTRYFMLTSEAVGLVLQSIVMAKGGEIFVLDMGEPVRIFEMAEKLIHLAGKIPGKDIEIVFSGLKPGEKLYEELILEGSEQQTLHDDVFVATPQEIDAEKTMEKIDGLLAASLNQDQEEAKHILWDLAYKNKQSELPKVSHEQAMTSDSVH